MKRCFLTAGCTALGGDYIQRHEELYKAIIEENLEKNIKSAASALEYIKNSTAKYHGRCVRSLYMPKIFTADAAACLEQIAVKTYSILEKVISHYISDSDYRKLFGFDTYLERLIIRPPRYKGLLPIVRVDLFFNEDTYDFKFCEFNSDGTSAMNEDRELNSAFSQTFALKKFKQQYNVKVFELFDTWIDEFLSIYETFARKVSNPRVAIVDFMENATENEFKIFASRFKARGMEAEICELSKLKYDGRQLYSPNGNIINAVYRRAVTCDIMQRRSESADFLAAVEDDAVCVIGDFRTQVVHNKILFMLLNNPATYAFLNEDEISFLKAHVPFTARLDDSFNRLTEVLSQKDRWIIKPEDLYGSRGVHAGVECSEQEWEKVVKENLNNNYLIQEFYRPFRSVNIDLMNNPNAAFSDYYNITGLYVYNGKFCGIYSRVSKTEIISTQYSEITLPTLTLD